jgi:hypothetical protein
VETITCDPAVFAPGRVELALDGLGLAIRGEPDWGDSDMELFLVRCHTGSRRSLDRVAGLAHGASWNRARRSLDVDD